MKPVRNKRA